MLDPDLWIGLARTPWASSGIQGGYVQNKLALTGTMMSWNLLDPVPAARKHPFCSPAALEI